MGAPQDNSNSSFTCKLRIIRAKNIELKHTKGLFVRCYLSAGTNKNAQLNSQEIPSNSDLCWNNSFSLNCLGTEESINTLKQENMVIELRCRSKSSSILGMIGGSPSSQLLGRAEIPWRTVFESPNLEIETWVSMISKRRGVDGDVKPPAVRVAIEIKYEETKMRKNSDKLRKWSDECGCRDGGCNCLDYDMFALGLACEAL